MTARESIQALQNEYTRATNAADIDAYLGTLAEDIVFCAPDRPPISGHDDVAQWMQDDFLTPFNVQFSASFDNIDVVGSKAYAPGTFTLDLTPKEGGETMHLTGEFFDIVEERGNGWKLKHIIFNFDQPMGSATSAENKEMSHQA